MTKRIFISKADHEVTAIRAELAKAKIELVSESLISFEAEKFEIENEVDVIFFGSIRSVIFYSATNDIGNAKAIACIGGKTSELLKELGYTPNFTGTNSGNPSEVASEFKSWCGNRNVLFPLSSRSLKSIARVFPVDQKEEVIVYRTILVEKEIPECDSYVFTSPSNLEGFLLENALPTSCHVIAWGKSTEKALKDRNIAVDQTLKNSSIEELLRLIA